MSDLLPLFQNLSKFFDPSLHWEQIEEKYEASQENAAEDCIASNCDSDSNHSETDSDDDNDDDTDCDENIQRKKRSKKKKLPSKIKLVKDISIVKVAINNPQVLSVLQEICTTIRNLRDSNTGYDNRFDCWDRVIEICPRDRYLAFMYTLLGLAKYQPSSKTCRKLALAAISTYFLSLTIPGSKGFHIFDDKIVNQALEVFYLVQWMRDDKNVISAQNKVEVWVTFSNICDDIKLLFRYVHFDEYQDIRNAVLWELNKVLYSNHLNGYENIYSANFHSKCFEIYDEVINAHNGDPEETLMKIMRISYCLHIFSPTPKRKDGFITRGGVQLCEHVSDWFVRIINKYPRIVPKTLKFYIECVVTNPEKEWRNDHLQKALDYAAKYDAALYTNCNESIVPFLRKACNSDDSQIRTNAIDLLLRIILIESNVNWEVFRHEISNIPREVYLIKELIDRLIDINNSIKLKALHALSTAYTKGSSNTIKIISEGIRFACYKEDNVKLPREPRLRSKELLYKCPKASEPAYTFAGYEEITESFNKLPMILYYLFRNNSVNVRKAATAFMDTLVLLNPLVIFQTNFVKEYSKLGDDPSIMVRKQALITIDIILGELPNCFPVIYTWCHVIVPLFKDSDQKATDAAWECFKMRVFNNIKGIDESNEPEHYMPWIIIRVMLTTQSRHFLQTCVNASITRQFIDGKTITLIESHTLTANSTEAWTMLFFIAGKFKLKEPDTLISTFIKSLLEESWNAGHNLQIILEVLTICISDFSHTALNMAFSNIVKLMKIGNIPTNIISKAFNFCMTISCQSLHKGTAKEKKSKAVAGEIDTQKRNATQMKWVTDIHATAEKYLVGNLQNFYKNKKTIMSFLFTYTEANTELPVRPHNSIVDFIHKFLKEFVNTPESDFEPEDITVVNQMIILAARFSIRDPSIAQETLQIYRLILRKCIRPTTVNNVILCITDLCKRHAQLVELHITDLLLNLKSPYLEIRNVTFQNLAQLILQDLLKLRGKLLICMMTSILDESPELSNIATKFFLTYLEKKNSALFQTCLLECPFVFNGYMHFEGFDSFSNLQSRFESPLKGDEKEKSRQMLYKVFILEQEEIIQLAFFDNLRLIFGKIKTDESIKSKEGCSMIKDILFILKSICLVGLDKRDAKSKDSEKKPEDDVETVMPSEAPTNEDANQNKKRKKNNALTMSQAIAIVEKSVCLLPKIAEKILDWDSSFEKYLSELSIAICKRFDSIVEFIQPTSYWSKYKSLAKDQLNASKKRKIDVVEENEEEADNVVNLTDSRKIRRTNFLSILFQPFLAEV